MSVFYTAAGRRGEAQPTFGQQVMVARLQVASDRGRVTARELSEHREVVRSAGKMYLLADDWFLLHVDREKQGNGRCKTRPAGMKVAIQ